MIHGSMVSRLFVSQIVGSPHTHLLILFFILSWLLYFMQDRMWGTNIPLWLFLTSDLFVYGVHFLLHDSDSSRHVVDGWNELNESPLKCGFLSQTRDSPSNRCSPPSWYLILLTSITLIRNFIHPCPVILFLGGPRRGLFMLRFSILPYGCHLLYDSGPTVAMVNCQYLS